MSEIFKRVSKIFAGPGGILFVAALLFYPVVWLILLPFRLVGIAVSGALQLVWEIVTLPVRILGRLARA